MTQKIYYDTPYLKHFNAKIKEIKFIDGKYHVLLDSTAFYPEGGGQPCDTGYINKLKVNYVYEKDGEIYHVMDEKLVDEKVNGEINFEKRFDYMQQHSGEHILSAAFHQILGTNNTSFHLGDDYVSIDIDIQNIDDAKIKSVEELANDIIATDLPIKSYVVDNLDRYEITLRKKINIDGPIRVVQIGNFDFSGCCGIHVQNTCEVESIKVLKYEKNKTGTRIYFICGNRVFNDYNNKLKFASDISKLFECKQEDVLSKAKTQMDTIKDLNKQIRNLKEKFIKMNSIEILKACDNNILNIVFEDESFEDVQLYNKEFINTDNLIIILSSKLDNKILLNYSGVYNINCGNLFKENINQFDGKGGGSAKIAQGTFKNTENLIKFNDFLVEYIKENIL